MHRYLCRVVNCEVNNLIIGSSRGRHVQSEILFEQYVYPLGTENHSIAIHLMVRVMDFQPKVRDSN